MAENRALSQWEIDALLNQIPGGGQDASPDDGQMAGPTGERLFSRAVKTYDFRRPDKFSKEQWATLQQMHDHFARLVGSAFSTRLRSLVSVRLSSIDQGLYEEWQAQVPNQTVCYVLGLRPLQGSMVIEIGTDIAHEVIDRLLGGSGILIDRARTLSEVEMELLRSFGRALTQSQREMWAQLQPLDPQVQDIGLDAGLIQVAAPTDVVVTAFFEVNIGNQLGAMSICVPYDVIEPLGAKLSSKLWMASGTRGGASQQERESLQALLGHTEVELAVRLGGVDVPARSIVELREGDTLVLDSRVGRALDVAIGERTRFRGLPGTLGNHVALQVAEVVEQPRFVFNDRTKDGPALELLDLDPPSEDTDTGSDEQLLQSAS